MSAIETVKSEMKIHNTSKVGLLINVESQEAFNGLIGKSGNVADLFVDAEKLIAQKLEIGADAKRIIDAQMKPLKTANENLRVYMTKYMIDSDIEKIDGVEAKSVSLIKAKTTNGVISTKQIKIKNKFVDIDTLSKDDLIKLLEEVGFKIRIDTKEVSTTKEASIIVRK